MSGTILQVGDSFHEYILGRVIGGNSLGELWFAEHKDRGKTVILLIIRDQFSLGDVLDGDRIKVDMPEDIIVNITGGSLDHDPPFIVMEVEEIPEQEEPEEKPRKKKTWPSPIPFLLQDKSSAKLEKRISRLVSELTNESHFIRATAARSLGMLGAKAASAIPNLIEVLVDPWTGARAAAAEALGNMGALAIEAVPFLMQLLDSESDRVRLAVLDAAGRIGEPAKEAIPALLLELENPRCLYVEKARSLASKSLKELAFFMDEDEVMHVARLATGHKNIEIRMKAMHVLRSCLPFSDEIIPSIAPALVIALDDDNISAIAESILARMRPKSLPYLIPKLKDESLSYKVAGVLADIGSASMESLVDALDDDSVYVRANAAMALGRIGEPAQSALPRLYEALADESRKVRARAAAAMMRMGGKGVSYLVKASKDSNPDIRKTAQKALRKPRLVF